MTDQKSFRAIIVGGGLVGLTAAHIFAKAGIDFILLERRENVTSSYGTTLAFWPQTFRIFDQLGILEPLKPLLESMERSLVISTEDARVLMEDETFKLMEKNHGHPLKIIHRPYLAKHLYESLPESVKAYILTKRRVVDIDVFEDGVRVACDDGSIQEGSIVIGADGVHSTVRKHVQACHLGKRPEDLSKDEANPYATSYRLYFSTLPPLPGLVARTRWDATQDNMTTQIIVGSNNRTWFGVYEKIEPPTLEHRKYTETDKEEVLRKWGDVYMAPGWKFRDIDAKRNNEVGLIDLEEGLVETWFWKRLVLAGDAIRKMEPHAGLGYNCGVMDIVVLVNALRRLLQSCEAPSTQELENVFDRYQEDRAEETQQAADISFKAVRYMAWPSFKERVVAKYAMPYLPLNRWTFNNRIGPLISRTPVLEWLDESELPVSRMPWQHHSNNETVADNRRAGLRLTFTALLLFPTLIVTTCWLVGENYDQLRWWIQRLTAQLWEVMGKAEMRASS